MLSSCFDSIARVRHRSHPRKRPRRPRRPPEAVDERSSAAGLRAVAVLEAVKGLLVLLLGLGLLSLLHKDFEDVAENFLFRLHISAGHRVGRAIIDAVSKLTDARLWGIAGAAAAYSAVRFTEAWGLWNRRVWAEWFALLSGALYLPVEILKLAERASWLHISLFVGNVAILLYMVYIRVEATRTTPAPAP
jgi:uncharacterized membrane protein (DUF2068 family)